MTRTEHARIRREEAAAGLARNIGEAMQASASYDATGTVLTVLVPSQTEPKRLTYKVQAVGETAVCNCRGFASHSHCKHATAVERLLKEPST